MVELKLVNIGGQEFTVPDRLSGDGPEITITICRTGEFIDPESDELRFMPRPEPPLIERLEVQGKQSAAEVDMGGIEKWDPTADEMNLAEEEGAKLRRLLKGYFG